MLSYALLSSELIVVDQEQKQRETHGEAPEFQLWYDEGLDEYGLSGKEEKVTKLAYVLKLVINLIVSNQMLDRKKEQLKMALRVLI